MAFQERRGGKTITCAVLIEHMYPSGLLTLRAQKLKFSEYKLEKKLGEREKKLFAVILAWLRICIIR